MFIHRRNRFLAAACGASLLAAACGDRTQAPAGAPSDASATSTAPASSAPATATSTTTAPAKGATNTTRTPAAGGELATTEATATASALTATTVKDEVKIMKEHWEGTRILKFSYEMRRSASGKWDRNGMSQAYYASGKLEREGPYKDGKRVGMWTYYDEQGNVLRTENRGGLTGAAATRAENQSTAPGAPKGAAQSAPQGSDGAPQGSGGAPQGSGGAPQGSGGAPQGSDGAPQGSGGAPQGSADAPHDDDHAGHDH